ncbi:hypothetical protein J2Y48_003935 [Mycoplana sp. BE70]|uniref:hypothetical protein n=1 Tax=Mycoplana sp. BE70 TaxID=2817775 RepID=UPI00285A4E2C|nr:hypothetical protein [Mycoplana sp. BE70]MDR6758627.1 hypothetical protein [Mycoplana sp. BE70]
MTTRPLSHSISAGVAVIFGLVTVLSGGRALFGDANMGAVVPFVLWFNCVAGFVYVLTGFALWRGAGWAFALSIGVAVATALAFAAFLWHVWRGGPYELRTAVAMVLRFAVWSAIVTVAAGNRRVRRDCAVPHHENSRH